MVLPRRHGRDREHLAAYDRISPWQADCCRWIQTLWHHGATSMAAISSAARDTDTEAAIMPAAIVASLGPREHRAGKNDGQDDGLVRPTAIQPLIPDFPDELDAASQNRRNCTIVSKG